MASDPYKWYDVSSRGALENTARRGSRWFYWIAGLSLINTVLQYGGAPIRVVLGPAFTQLVDGIVAATLPQPYFISLAIDIVIAAAFVGFGYLSGRGEILAFLVGLVLYALDGLLYFVLMFWTDIFSGIVAVIWHSVAAYFLWKGLQAAKELKALPSSETG